MSKTKTRPPGCFPVIRLYILLAALLIPALVTAQNTAERTITTASSRELPAPRPDIALDSAQEPPDIKGLPSGQMPFRITSDEFLDYDEESNFIYGRSRTRIWYRDIYLEADRVIYDVRLNEVQAYGNIIMTQGDDKYKAESLWYNLDTGRGHAFGASGRRKGIFIHGDPRETDVPGAELLGHDENRRPREAIFRNSSMSSCDFPVPHYRIRAKEILLYPQDRVFFRHATLYIREIPVFYMPAYTRSLDESFPWTFRVGYSSRVGGYLRIAYDYKHAEYEPQFGNEGDMVKKNQGHLSAYADYFTKRGFGYGAKYKYHFDYDRHNGIIDLYRISDKKYDPKTYDENGLEQTSDDEARWIANVKHRSQITDEIYFHLNIDEMSDPDVYYDLLDRFNEVERNRLASRNIRAALTYRDDNIVGRILLQHKNRLGRDRITNFANPADNDADFDADPLRGDEDEDEGIPHDRYGVVSERLPQVTFSTNYLKIPGAPLYTYTDLNIINNLDRGLNLLNDEDDAWVRGVDLYQALLYRLRFSPRYTLTARLGVGASYMRREKDDYDYKFAPGTVFPYDQTELEGGLTFLDEDTFLVGRRYSDTTAEQLASWRRRSLDEVKDYYLYADIMLHLHARFTDYLHGWIRYDYREGSDDSLGEFYESLGDNLIREDLYNFRTPQHWVRGGLRYFLLYPNLTAYLSGGYNLQSGEDIFANEELYFASTGFSWANNADTFRLSTSLRYSDRQEYDPSDPNSDELQSITAIMSAQYMPQSKFWWARVNAAAYRVLNSSDNTLRRDRGFDEYDTEMDVVGILGGKIGPKYTLEGRVRWKERYEGNGLSNLDLIIKRDLHDFIATALVGVERDVTDNQYDEDDKQTGDLKFKGSFTLEFKSPYQDSSIGVAPIRVLADSAKEADVAGQSNIVPVFIGD